MEIDRTVIQSVLECVACRQYLQPPVHSCATGHSVCLSCLGAIKACPICLLPIMVSFSRNYILEDVLKSVLMVCQNDRCKDCVSPFSLSAHLETCPDCQELTCIEGCGDLQANLPQHLVLVHGYKLFEMKELGGVRHFVAPLELWKTEVLWPRYVWQLGQVSLVVTAKVHAGQFHIFLYRLSREDVDIVLKIGSDKGSLAFRGKLPHLRRIFGKSGSIAHLTCEVQELLKFYLVPQDDDPSLLQLLVHIKC